MRQESSSCPYLEDFWSLDSFLQEITFQHGLYYYLCTVSNRRAVARSVVKPVFEELLALRFSVAYPVQIQKHLLEGSPDWAGGEFLEGTAQAYEILFQKLQLKMVTGYEFVRDADDLLTEFMLRQLGALSGRSESKIQHLGRQVRQAKRSPNQGGPKAFQPSSLSADTWPSPSRT